jgi:Transcriptional activator of glycolytic enzymes
MTPAQLVRWNCLLTKYSEAHVHKHSWEWVQGNFIPFYVYQLVSRLTDYWTEWMEGISGFISMRELTEVWREKWRRNNGGQQTECGRLKKVIDLLTALSA